MIIDVKEGVILQTLGKSMIILDTNTGKYLETNAEGAKIFSIIEKTRELKKVLEVYLEDKDADDSCEDNFNAFISTIKKLGIVDTYEK